MHTPQDQQGLILVNPQVQLFVLLLTQRIGIIQLPPMLQVNQEIPTVNFIEIYTKTGLKINILSYCIANCHIVND